MKQQPRAASGVLILHGPPSRQGYHIGPIYYYYLSFLSILSRDEPKGIAFWNALFQSVIERKDKYVPVLAVLLAAQVQTHYAMVFPLAGMVISILFIFWKERSLSDIKNSQKIYIIAGTLLFLLFLPSAYS